MYRAKYVTLDNSLVDRGTARMSVTNTKTLNTVLEVSFYGVNRTGMKAEERGEYMAKEFVNDAIGGLGNTRNCKTVTMRRSVKTGLIAV